MTSTEVEKLIRDALTSAGLWHIVDQYKSQFLEFPDGFFAEIVLHDGSKLADVGSVVRQVEEHLRRQGTELDVIIRAHWNVERVKHVGTAGAAAGRPRLAETFEAILVSGGYRTLVTVDVTHTVWLGIAHRSPGSPPEPEFGPIDASNVEETNRVTDFVIQFLQLRLSFGGANYWDPIREPSLELNESALQYLTDYSSMGQGAKS